MATDLPSLQDAHLAYMRIFNPALRNQQVAHLTNKVISPLFRGIVLHHHVELMHEIEDSTKGQFPERITNPASDEIVAAFANITDEKIQDGIKELRTIAPGADIEQIRHHLAESLLGAYYIHRSVQDNGPNVSHTLRQFSNDATTQLAYVLDSAILEQSRLRGFTDGQQNWLQKQHEPSAAERSPLPFTAPSTRNNEELIAAWKHLLDELRPEASMQPELIPTYETVPEILTTAIENIIDPSFRETRMLMMQDSLSVNIIHDRGFAERTRQLIEDHVLPSFFFEPSDMPRSALSFSRRPATATFFTNTEEYRRYKYIDFDLRELAKAFTDAQIARNDWPCGVEDEAVTLLTIAVFHSFDERVASQIDDSTRRDNARIMVVNALSTLIELGDTLVLKRHGIQVDLGGLKPVATAPPTLTADRQATIEPHAL